MGGDLRGSGAERGEGRGVSSVGRGNEGRQSGGRVKEVGGRRGVCM